MANGIKVRNPVRGIREKDYSAFNKLGDKYKKTIHSDVTGNYPCTRFVMFISRRSTLLKILKQTSNTKQALIIYIQLSAY